MPASAEHIISRMRLRLPLLPASSRTVKDKAGNDAQAMDIPFNLLIQRMIDCPRVMEEISSNFGGHVMSARDRRRSGVSGRHLTPVPTRRADGAINVFINGGILRSSSRMGIDCVTAAGGGGEVRVMVGDTLMVELSTSSTVRPVSCKLAGLHWQEHSAPPRQGVDTATDGVLVRTTCLGCTMTKKAVQGATVRRGRRV